MDFPYIETISGNKKAAEAIRVLKIINKITVSFLDNEFSPANKNFIERLIYFNGFIILIFH